MDFQQVNKQQGQPKVPMERKNDWYSRPTVPILPNWCDYHRYTPQQKVVFIGVTRAILTLIAFALCVAYLSVYNVSTGEKVVLIIIIIISILQCFACLYYIYAGRSGNLQALRRWMVVDIVITTCLIASVVALLCLAPLNRLAIVLGVKLIVITVLLCYFFSYRAMQLMVPPAPFPSQNFVNPVRVL